MMICFLLCSSIIGIACVQPAAGLQCNEFPPGSHYGIVTSSCGDADNVARELLADGSNVGVLGGMRQENDTVTGRFTMFRLNEENMSIDGFGVWNGGGIYQLFDGITFNDAISLTSSIDGAVFNATFDSTNVHIHNHPGVVMEIDTERSVNIKFTMAGGINSSIMSAEEIGDPSIEGARIGNDAVSATVMVTGGSLEQAGNRSLIVNLARGGEIVVRASSDNTPTQDMLLDAIISDVLAEYWVLARDDGAIFDIAAYRDVDLESSSLSLKMGEWEIPLPVQAPGNVIGVHTDRMSVTIAGGVENMLSLGEAASEVGSLDEVLQAADGNGQSPVYYVEQTNQRTDIYLFVPATLGGEESTGGGSGAGGGQAIDLGSMFLPAVIGAVVLIAIVSAVLLIRRKK